MYKRHFKRNIVLFILIAVAFIINNTSFAEKHWADREVQYLLEKGIVSGYSDGSFRPNNNITRAEFIKLINNSLGTTERAEVGFKDVKKGDWFYEEVEKALSIGYIHGYGDNTLRPNNPITREEAAKVIVLAFGLDKDDINNQQLFKDDTQIANWSKEYVYKLYDKNYVSGYLDKTFRPGNFITRGEVVKIITNISGDIINIQGDYSETLNNNLLINTPSVNLKDIHIRGDLILVEGIGDGKIILDNVIVDGTIYVKSGELIIKNSNINKMIINKKTSKYPIILDNTRVSKIIAYENTNLIGKNKTHIKSLEIRGKANIETDKSSKIENIEILAEDVELNIQGDADLIVPKEPAPDKPKDDGEEPDDRPTEKYVFVANLDKNKYGVDEDIKVSGKVLKDNKGLEGVDITSKMIDSNGKELILVDQIKTNRTGEFKTSFKVPEGLNIGEYKLIIKANNPINVFVEKPFSITNR